MCYFKKMYFSILQADLTDKVNSSLCNHCFSSLGKGKYLRIKNNSWGPIIQLWGIKAEQWFAFWNFVPVGLMVCYCTRPRHVGECSKSPSFAQETISSHPSVAATLPPPARVIWWNQRNPARMRKKRTDIWITNNALPLRQTAGKFLQPCLICFAGIIAESRFFIR